MPTYTTSGHSYLVCPKLIEIDARYKEHWSKGKPCRRGKPCLHNHEHETPLVTNESHTVNDFFWKAGSRPHEPEEHPTCDLCGEKLVYADLDDLYDPKHFKEIIENAEI